VTGIAIYMEGGGHSRDTRTALRLGMDAFLAPLKDAARTRGWRWRLIACGSRNEAIKGFAAALGQRNGELSILLVDAEGPVAGSPAEHLRQSHGPDLRGAEDGAIHLMVQVMETWIVADPDALATYYGPGFAAARLPKSQDLETVAKADITQALQNASAGSSKGAYHKIRHAKDLLMRIDREIVRRRCPFCERLFARVGMALDKG
jgi:hypothetical protein